MGTTNTLDLNNRVTNLEKAVSGGDSAQANKTDIATEFSATINYTAGCFVYHGGKLYQFNADHSAGAWDPTDAVEANVTDQVVSNAAAIAGLTATDVAYDNTDSGLTATDVQGALDELRHADNIMMSDGVTSVEDRISAHTMSVPTDIPYNTLYTVPNDGYVRIGGSSGIATGDIKILASDNQEYGMERIINQYEFKSIFVRKGMKVKWASDPANAATCRFHSLS